MEGLPGVGVIHGGQLHGLPERGLCMRGTIYRVGGGERGGYPWDFYCKSRICKLMFQGTISMKGLHYGRGSIVFSVIDFLLTVQQCPKTEWEKQQGKQ